jgi:lipopolysaccharide/colanic/teichoic acid biosynthesis glycosyltransferase
MRLHRPTARARATFRLAPYDLGVAVLSPYFALYMRDAAILSTSNTMVALYCGISLICSLGAFLAFRIEGPIPRYFSANDALNLAKAVMVGELLTAIVVFSLTRLEGVPRTVPAIHALMLGAGLFAARAFVRFVDNRRKEPSRERPDFKEHIILIGLSDQSVLFIRFLETVTPDQYQVIAVLDTEARSVGHSVHGVPVCGPPSHLGALIDEFAVHGVRTDRVIIGEASDLLPMQLIQRECARLNINLSFVTDFFSTVFAGGVPGWDQTTVESTRPNDHAPAVTPSSYFRVKARVEFPIVIAIIIFALPICLIAGVLALLDVGSPILFWQRRVGLHGRLFQLYKIRTLRAAFDREGQKAPKAQRLSGLGRWLRRTRLDELPQLLNVLVGDMSLVGPRPLLPEDQPANPEVRLMVRPGLTGWAQVNGGTLLSPEEKEELDEWYVRRASPWLDLKIVGLTLLCLIRGDRRSEEAFGWARADQVKPRIVWSAPAPDRAVVHPLKGKSGISAARAR